MVQRRGTWVRPVRASAEIAKLRTDPFAFPGRGSFLSSEDKDCTHTLETATSILGREEEVLEILRGFSITGGGEGN
jgi:hypothetical protein